MISMPGEETSRWMVNHSYIEIHLYCSIERKGEIAGKMALM